MRKETDSKVNLLSIFMLLLLLPMAVGYFAVNAIEFTLTKLIR